MRRLLLQLWGLPWPAWLRRWSALLLDRHWIQRWVVPQFLVGVVGVVQNGEGEVLLLKHTYRLAHPWGLPTGFLEGHEQPDRALERELREETGFTIEALEPALVYAHRKRRHLNLVYRGRYIGGLFKPSLEVSEAQFFSLDGLPPMLEDQLWVVREVLRKKVI
ncbi:MAG TPA: NUDIX domain-containing protein [Chloroflexota bacterium]